MNKIFKVLTLVLIMMLCIGVIFTFVGCKDDKPENELQFISVIIGEGEEKLILSVDNANENAIRSAISVTATFSGNDIAEIIEQYEIVGFDANAEGEQTVTIKYSTVNATIKVTVEHPVLPQEPTLESIKVTPESLTIAEADASVDAIKGKIVVTAVYSDKSENVVSDYTVEGFYADAEGEQNVTIKYLTVSAVVKVTIARPTEPEQIKIYVNTDTEGKVLNESPSGDANVVKQYSITIELEGGDLVKISAGKIKYNNYDKTCGFKGVAVDKGEYTFYVKLYQDGTHSIWVDKPASTDPEPYKVNLIVNNGDPKAMTIYESDDANVTVQYTIKVSLKKDDKVTIKDSDDFTFVNYEEEYTSFRGTATIDGEYTFYVKKYKDDTHSIWVGVPTSVDPDVPVTGDTITIYYYNVKGWANVNAYAWVSGTDGTGWPGQPMTAVEGQNGWYQAEVSSENNRILFNAGDKMPKTLDLEIDINHRYFNGYEWTDGYNLYDGPLSHTIYYYNTNKWSVVNAYAWVGDDTNEAWPGKPMEAVADHDGWYSIEIGIEYKYIQFNGGTDFTKTDDIDINKNLYYYNEGWVSGFGESVDPTPNPDVPTITENSEVYLVIGDTKTKLDINKKVDEGKLEFMIEKIALEANSTFTITVDGKEYANYKEKSPFKGSVEEAGKYSIYVSNEGIWADKAKEESDPTVPTITKESVVKLVIGEKDTSFIINEKASEGVIEFMIEKIELDANTTFTITVDGQIYANYKEESLKGSVTDAGDYCFYVSNDGIYVAIYTPPYTVSISINDGEPMVMTESQSTLDDVKVEYKATVELNKDDKVTIKDSKGVIFSKYENEDVFNGIAVAGGKYTFYVKEYNDSRENLIYVGVETSGDPDTPDIPQEPTLESIKLNKTELTIEKANANIEYIKEQITVTAVYSDNGEEIISKYEISGLNAESYEAQTLTISYEGKTADLKVMIQKPTPVISSIKVDKASIVLSESEATVDGIKSKIEVKYVYGGCRIDSSTYNDFVPMPTKILCRGNHGRCRKGLRSEYEKKNNSFINGCNNGRNVTAYKFYNVFGGYKRQGCRSLL